MIKSKESLLATMAVAAIWFTTHPVVAQVAVSVSGGGIAVFDSAFQIDADPDTDGSKFGLNFVIGTDGTVEGDFRYLMTGNVDFDGLGPQVMHGTVTDANRNEDGTVTFYSQGFLHNWKGQFLEASVWITVKAGGAGVGTLQATFNIPAFSPNPIAFNVQTVTSGQIKIR